MKTIVLALAGAAAAAALSGCVVAPYDAYGGPAYGSVTIESGPYYRGDRGYYRGYGDRDRDGVPNRFDRRPGNPYRY